jgi:hypothetical protein
LHHHPCHSLFQPCQVKEEEGGKREIRIRGRENDKRSRTFIWSDETVGSLWVIGWGEKACLV